MFAYAEGVEEARQLIKDELDAAYRGGYFTDDNCEKNFACLDGNPQYVYLSKDSVGYVVETYDKDPGVVNVVRSMFR